MQNLSSQELVEFKDKVLLITGGTGSFGGTVVERFLNSSLAEVRIFSRDEKKQEDMRLKFANPKLKFYIGDVRDFQSVDAACKGVDYVFHAAALKQVPSCEFYPLEAIKTNELGTENVIRSSINNKVKKFVLLSTDKAVYPINAMGISKAMAEKIMLSIGRQLDHNDTVVCATRYGNVMGSRGSVIPLFRKQLEESGEVTVTDPKMTRFLMTLPESVDLVIYAFLNAEQGDIFVQKSPACDLSVLAEAVALQANKEMTVKTIGTRHGEKLYETLISREEMARSIDLGSYHRIPLDGRDLNYSKFFVDGSDVITESHDYTSHNTNQLDVNGTLRLLEKMDAANSGEMS